MTGALPLCEVGPVPPTLAAKPLIRKRILLGKNKIFQRAMISTIVRPHYSFNRNGINNL